MSGTDRHLSLAPTPPCRHCKKRLADGLDQLCTPCRAESACTSLTETLTNALENFLDDRWDPHEFGCQLPAYYRDSPDFDGDPLTYETKIAAAYDQIVTGVQQLIELALGRQVQMDAEVRRYHDGFHAAVDWSPEE